MVSLDDAIVARLSLQGKNFEVFVDPDLALALRKGNQVSMNDLLAYEAVYKDAKKGEVASEHDLKKLFKTDNIQDIARTIVMKGEVHLTTKQKRELQEQIRRQVVNLIASQAVDPRTKAPHPPVRIERAMEEAKVHIDVTKAAEAQVPDVVDKLRGILPISFETVKLELKIPSNYASKAFSVLQKYNPSTSDWLADGSLLTIVKLPPGSQDDFMSEINKVVHGNLVSRIL